MKRAKRERKNEQHQTRFWGEETHGRRTMEEEGCKIYEGLNREHCTTGGRGRKDLKEKKG